MKFKKSIRVELPEFLAWCRAQPCSFCGRSPAGQAHHVGGKGMGGARRRDDLAVPACDACHKRCHGLTVTVEGKRLGRILKADQLAASDAAYKRWLSEPDETVVPF